MGESDVLTHECLTLPVVQLGYEVEPIVYQRGEFGVGMLTTPLDHVHGGVGATALVAEDGP